MPFNLPTPLTSVPLAHDQYRYPIFTDALRDIDDALCLVSLFACLPLGPRIAPTVVESCFRLASEWQLYVMYTRSLRKVFLSIKGVYFQAEVCGETITWLVPYMFTQAVCILQHKNAQHFIDHPSQKIPTDVDIRVMLTFLELYQTLLGFVFFKLYSDAELVYPPALDPSKNNNASGIGAFNIATATADRTTEGQPIGSVHDKAIKGRDVRRTVKEISGVPTDLPNPSPAEMTKAKSDAMNTPDSSTYFFTSPSTSIFSAYTFYLAPGSPRHLLEFMIRSFGGRVGWPPSMGSGSPLQENDESITHVIIDRPLSSSTQVQRNDRKFVQPQWVADSINAQKALPEGPYVQGATLPPHLSPFGEEYNSGALPVSHDISLERGETVARPDAPVPRSSHELALQPAPENTGLPDNEFSSANDAQRSTTANLTASYDKDMNKIMMSNKRRKLYERIRHSEHKRVVEVCVFFASLPAHFELILSS